MAGSLNKVLLIGRLGADPEIKQMVNGKSVARLSLATSQSWKDKNTGEKKEISDMWMSYYIDKLDDKQKKELIMSSGLNNLEYTILERKMIHDMVEVIKVEI